MSIYELIAKGDLILLMDAVIVGDIGLVERKTAAELKNAFPKYSEYFSGCNDNENITPLKFLYYIDNYTYHILFDDIEHMDNNPLHLKSVVGECDCITT